MASTSSECFGGMSALIADLGRMNAEVQTEASGVVRATAELMRADVVSAYAEDQGVLKARVVVEASAADGGQAILRFKVRSKAPHAHLYEYGTVQRFTNATGANRGTMPAKPTFVPAAVRARRRMTAELEGVLRRAKVRGMTGAMEVRKS